MFNVTYAAAAAVVDALAGAADPVEAADDPDAPAAEPEAPLTEAVCPTQAVDVPAVTVTAEEKADAPVESLMARPTLVLSTGASDRLARTSHRSPANVFVSPPPPLTSDANEPYPVLTGSTLPCTANLHRALAVQDRRETVLSPLCLISPTRLELITRNL